MPDNIDTKISTNLGDECKEKHIAHHYATTYSSSNKFRNPDDSMARRTSGIKKKLDDSTARRAATLFAAM